MTDIFDRWYTFAKSKRGVPMERIIINGVHRDIIKACANTLLPSLYRRGRAKHSLEKSAPRSPRVVVTLTSIPSRIERLWLVIESILRQKHKPDIITLWLSREQFPDIEMLPQRLLEQRSRGLSIEICESNIKVHTKYHYAMSEYLDDIIITLDDDIYYRSTTISSLIECHQKHPEAIIANRAHALTFDCNGEIRPYVKWPLSTMDSSLINMQTGVGGVLYPPHSLYKDALDIDLAMKLAPFADDLWLFVMARLNGRTVIKSEMHSHLLPVPNPGRESLVQYNVGESRNDKQVAALREYYSAQLGIDPFAAEI